MLLVIDVGNTNTVLGVFEGKELRVQWRLTTSREQTADEYGILARNLFTLAGMEFNQINGVMVASVVPPLNSVLEEMAAKYFHLKPLFLEPGIRTGLAIHYDNPLEVGADRIADSIAAFEKYGGPCIVVDFGTAITFDVVSEKGEYLGGVIAPGLGISAEALGRIFDQFSQVDGSSTRHHQGTGLGLSISQGIVAMMGGEIGVTSVPGEGSVFWFTVALPIADPTEQPARIPVEIAGKRALVIDDNETNRFILHELLTAWRIDEASAASGNEGMQRLVNTAAQGRPFDIVILDHHMPGMDGADVLRAIRGAFGIEATPVIMSTSIDEAGSAGIYKGLGAQGYLVKPAPASQLFDTIIDILSNQAVAAAPLDDEDAFATGVARGAAPNGRIDILLVEDNEVNRIVAEQTLLNAGLSHVAATNGVEAIEAFRKNAPRAILMDVSMPVMDGYLATHKIREIEVEQNLPHTPIIGLTAHALNGDREKCLEAGMDDYLAKPISTAKLTEMIETWIASAPAGTEEIAASAARNEGVPGVAAE